MCADVREKETDKILLGAAFLPTPNDGSCLATWEAFVFNN